jgi:DNA repair protein RecO (recombination protein O)
MPASFGYILQHRPFRETSMILDIFTEDYGRISCIARPARKRGKILKANLQPFRYLHLQWIGKGDLQTLTEADERGRHTIPASEMMLGLYLNELLLKLTHPHIALPDLFPAYKYTLHKLADPAINKHIMMRFEVYLLASLGYPLTVENLGNEVVDAQNVYIFDAEHGLLEAPDSSTSAKHQPKMSGDLLLALQDIQNMQESHWKVLRVFLDQVFQGLTPRTLHTRKLLKL